VKKGAAVNKGDRLVSLDCADAQASLSEAQERLTAAQEQARAAEASIGAARATQQVAGSARAAAEAQAASLSAQRDATLRQASRLDALTEDVALSSRDQTRASADGLSHQVEAFPRPGSRQSGPGPCRGRELEVVCGAGGSRPCQCPRRRGQRGPRASAGRRMRTCSTPRRHGHRAATRRGRVGSAGNYAGAPARPVRGTRHLLSAQRRTGHSQTGRACPGRGRCLSGRGIFRPGVDRGLQSRVHPRNIQTRSDRDRLVYPVEVVLANSAGKLRAGMPVQVSLPGTERR